MVRDGFSEEAAFEWGPECAYKVIGRKSRQKQLRGRKQPRQRGRGRRAWGMGGTVRGHQRAVWLKLREGAELDLCRQWMELGLDPKCMGNC